MCYKYLLLGRADQHLPFRYCILILDGVVLYSTYFSRILLNALRTIKVQSHRNLSQLLQRCCHSILRTEFQNPLPINMIKACYSNTLICNNLLIMENKSSCSMSFLFRGSEQIVRSKDVIEKRHMLIMGEGYCSRDLLRLLILMVFYFFSIISFSAIISSEAIQIPTTALKRPISKVYGSKVYGFSSNKLFGWKTSKIFHHRLIYRKLLVYISKLTKLFA